METNNTTRSSNNGMAIASLVFGILAWLLALIMLCLNFVIVPMLAVATFGVGGFLYICTISISCLSPLGWLVGAVTGYVAKNQIRQMGLDGMGMANAGFLMSLIGLGLTLLSICALIILPMIGISVPILSDPSLFNN